MMLAQSFLKKTGLAMGGLVLTLGLAACGSTYDYVDLHDRAITPGGFKGELSREYRKLSLYEQGEMRDYPDASLFARKSEAAALGKDVKPEQPKEWLASWEVTDEEQRNLVLARADLMAEIKKAREGEILNGKASGPAARAQVRFDCWLEQVEEGYQPGHIANCESGFQASLSVLKGLNDLNQGYRQARMDVAR